MKPAPIALVLILLAAGVAGNAAADRGGFVIDSFDTELEVGSDAGLFVEERITVDFLQPRRGIYRDIPVRYTDPIGYTYSLAVTVESVTDASGNDHTTRVRSHGRYLRIRIGDADRTLSGRVVYVIRYRVRDALGDFPEHHELYWNATGNEWRTTIRSAAATIRLPAALESDAVEAAGYTGPHGSKETNVLVTHPEPGVIRIESLGELPAFSGLTVVAAWPHGHVRFPSAAALWGRRLLDNWILAAPFLVLGLLVRRWRTRGRDPLGPASVVVRYEPPEGVTAGEIGALVDESMDLRDVTASIVDLAVRGHLTIRMETRPRFLGLGEREEPSFVRGGTPDQAVRGTGDGLTAHENRILEALFEHGDEVTLKDLRHKFYKHLPKIRVAVFNRLVTLGHMEARPDVVRNRYVGLGLLFGILVFGAGIAWANWRGAIFPTALIVPVVAGVLTLFFFLLFAPTMPRRTRSGVELRMWALGFEEFVDRVERERMEASEARSVFEALLPYAMALGVADRWAARFEGIYETASPAWYTGTHFPSGFSTSALESGLSSAMNDAGRSLTAAPRSSGSSGSGGGGFSGGGGGGGGGGSW